MEYLGIDVHSKYSEICGHLALAENFRASSKFVVRVSETLAYLRGRRVFLSVTLMTGTDSSKFADRLQPATYQNDTQVHFGIAASQKDPENWVGVSERLVARLTSMGMAYELHHVQMIDIYDDTTFKSQQCEKLYRELEFLATVTRDQVLGEVLNTLAGLIKPTLGKALHLTVSGN